MTFTSSSETSATRTLLWVLFSIYVVGFVRTAWLCDDYFITLRTIDNFVSGFGLRYNVSERVQSFTHPLWVMVLTPLYEVLRSPYAVPLLISAVLSLGTVAWVAFGLAATPLQGCLALMVLASSHAFLTFSTSGLENPLSHLLAVIFLFLYLAPGEKRERNLLGLALVAGLATTNRMDLILLFLPALLAVSWKALRWRAIGPLFWGFSPFLAWEIFSILYYGFPVPNTAYAKLGGGLPYGEILFQGFLYYVDSLSHDPLTLVVVVAALGTLLRRFDLESLALAVGLLAYLAYVVHIGGDFMRGRFFSTVLVMSVVILVHRPMPRGRTLVALGGAALAGLIQLFGLFAEHEEPVRIPLSGIVDERAFYFSHLGLPNIYRGLPVLEGPPEADFAPSHAYDLEVRVRGAIGLRTFLEGPGIHVLDPLGLADPLLARLPNSDPFDWRPGHLMRRLPEGYFETLSTGHNRIRDRDLARYYDHLQTVVRGRIFDPHRIRKLVELNLGYLDHLIQKERYQQPYSQELTLDELPGELPRGLPWDSPEMLRIPPGSGIRIDLGEITYCPELRIALSAGAGYGISYYLGDRPVTSPQKTMVQRFRLRIGPQRGSGLRYRWVQVPPQIALQGYDSVILYSGDFELSLHHSMGSLDLCEDDL